MSESQYFNIKISSPTGAKKQVSIDATKYIDVGCKLTDEDGLIKELRFDMKQAYLMLDVLSIGMRVDLIGGSLSKNEHLFNGYIKEITPHFKDTGEVALQIIAYSEEGKKLGIGVRDLVYPSKNSPKTWATKELMFSDIITNLAKDSGVRVESANIQVKKDIKASFAKGTVRQKNMTDWAFMQQLAEKIQCTLWTEEKGGVSHLHLVDNSSVVNKLADHTFFFVLRKNSTEFIDYTKTSDKQIQIVKAKVKLDTQSTKSGISQVTDPKTGKTKVVTKKKNKKGESETWVLDEEKLKGLSSDERTNLINLFVSGKVTWEGGEGLVAAKDYFKKDIITESSRQGEANNIEVEVSAGAIKEDGVGTDKATSENTGSKSFRTVIDEDKLREMSAEKRSATIGRIARGEMTEEDKAYYKVIDTTPKNDKSSNKNKKTGLGQSTQAGVDKSQNKGAATSSNKQKRDSGFSITCTVFGNISIKPRKSYVLEGLGKYSGKYYLYKISHEWGNNGYLMQLIFTK